MINIFAKTKHQQLTCMSVSMTTLEPVTYRFYGSILLFLMGNIFAMNVYAAHDLIIGDDPQYQQGLKIFSNYCSRCHGEHANGRGRTEPLYVKLKGAQPSNFQIRLYSFRPKEYLVNIVRDGGEKHSLSQYMPPFGGELTAGQIDDVVYFIQRISVYIEKTSMPETK